jgi:DNA primase
VIPDEIIEQIRESADIVGLIGESTELKRTGSDYRGPCPFHGGTHRNFAVIPKKGRFYCFVCKESGDVFSYLMKRFGMDYPTAVREVAGRMGITIPEQTSRSGPDPREPLFSAAAVAHDWFARQLREAPEAEEARAYLGTRGLDLDTVGPFELGYAPRGTAFLTAMAQLGLKEAVLLEAGLLAQRDDGSVAPRFRGRLLFPIHDLRGRVVGFGGRLLGPGEPKYLNSPETPIFKKGTMLYNLHEARQAIRKEESVVVVEGYFDVLRLVLAGCENVVAPLGTALTPDQAALLHRFAPQAVLLLDSDTAGLRATFRAGDELLRHTMRVRVATLPAGEDPDTLVKKGGLQALNAVLKDAMDVLERKIQLLERKGWFTGIEHRRDALDRLLPTIRAAKDPIMRELYLSLVSERTGVEKRVLEQEANAQPAPRLVTSETTSASPVPPPPVAPKQKVEKQLLSLMVHSDECRKRALSSIKPELIENEVHRELFERLLRVDGPGVATLADDVSDEARILWIRLLAQPLELEQKRLDAAFDGICVRLEVRPRFRELYRLDRQIHSAKDSAERDALVIRRTGLDLELRKNYPLQHKQYRERSVAAKRGDSRRTSHVPRPTSHDSIDP